MKQKTLLASLIVISCITSSKAQITKGATWLGGSFSISSSNMEDESLNHVQNTFIASPAVGKVIKDNLVVGLGLNYYQYRRKYGSENHYDATYFYGANVFARRYFPIVSRIYAFAHGSMGGSAIKTKYTSDFTPEQKGNGWSANLNIEPGLSFALGKKVHLEAAMGNILYANYSRIKNSNPGVQPNLIKSFDAGFSTEALSEIYIGVRFLL